MPLEEYLPALEEEIGEIGCISKHSTGVYYVETNRDGRFGPAYYVVLDTAPIAQTVQNYGKKWTVSLPLSQLETENRL